MLTFELPIKQIGASYYIHYPKVLADIKLPTKLILKLDYEKPERIFGYQIFPEGPPVLRSSREFEFISKVTEISENRFAIPIPKQYADVMKGGTRTYVLMKILPKEI